LEILTTDHWLLCNEIATARQVGPRDDTMLRVPTGQVLKAGLVTRQEQCPEGLRCYEAWPRRCWLVEKTRFLTLYLLEAIYYAFYLHRFSIWVCW